MVVVGTANYEPPAPEKVSRAPGELASGIRDRLALHDGHNRPGLYVCSFRASTPFTWGIDLRNERQSTKCGRFDTTPANTESDTGRNGNAGGDSNDNYDFDCDWKSYANDDAR